MRGNIKWARPTVEEGETDLADIPPAPDQRTDELVGGGGWAVGGCEGLICELETLTDLNLERTI